MQNRVGESVSSGAGRLIYDADTGEVFVDPKHR